MKPLLVLLVAVFALLTITVSAIARAQQAYEGRIDGTFEGWTGETVYKLMDGHIIQQSMYHYHHHYDYMPKVIIYQSNSSTYKIHIDGDNDDDVSIIVLK
jgi:ABC-type proline/glycine betaine transport system substrate-binding protein